MLPQRTKGNQRRYNQEEIENFAKKQSPQPTVKFEKNPSANSSYQETSSSPASGFRLFKNGHDNLNSIFANQPNSQSSITSQMFSMFKNMDYIRKGIVIGMGSILAVSSTAVLGVKSGLVRPHITEGPLASVIQKLVPPSYDTNGVRKIAFANAQKTTGQVLQAATLNPNYTFTVNIPAVFNSDVTFKGKGVVTGLTAGQGISITGTAQAPTITNKGKSFQTISVSGQDDVVAGSATDTLTLAGGTNVSITNDATNKKITINGPSDADVFKTLKVDSTSIAASGKSDSFTFVTGSGITLTADTTNKKLTIATSSTGVTSLNSLTGALTIAGAGINSVSASGTTVTITGTEADTLATVTGRGATTTTAVALNGGLTSSSASPITLSSTAPVIAIGNTGTLSITDGTNTLLSLADNGSTGTLTVNTLAATNIGAFTLTGNITGSGSPTLSSLGSINGLTLTANTTGFSVAGGTTSKTLTMNNTITFAGTDSTTITFQGTDTYVGRTTTDTLTNKTLTSPTIGTSPTAAGATWTDLGTVTTVAIAGGTINSTSIGATTASTGAFTTLSATPGSNAVALTLTGTNVTSANLAYLNSKNTSGTVLNLAYGAAATLAGSLTGQAIDVSTNVTATNQAVTAQTITLPSVTNTITTGSKNIEGVVISPGGGITQNGTGGTTNFYGADITIPALTQTAGTLNAYGVSVTTPSSITTGGTASGLYVAPTGIAAGTLYGVNIGAISSAGAGTEKGLIIGTGWDTDVTLSSTTAKLAIGNGGSLAITDGTNTLASVVDQGAYGTVRLTDKGSTGDPATCTAGDLYFNATDGTFKGCTATNTWKAFGSIGSSSPFTSTSGVIGYTTSTDRLKLTNGATGNTGLEIAGIASQTANPLVIDVTNVSGTVINASYTSAATLSGTITGTNIDLSTNVTATGQTLTGASLSLASADNPTGLNIGTIAGDASSGADGAITISSSTNINTTNSISGRSCADGGDAVNYSSTANTAAAATSIVLSSTPSSGCLAAGDKVLIINLQGVSGNTTNVGKYEFKTISSISTATLSFATGLTNGYDGTTQKIMVQRVPLYTNVTINNGGTLTASAWNGTKGGVLAFKASGTVTVTGTISAASLGYTGGASIVSGDASEAGNNGESIIPSAGHTTSANNTGGGGGVAGAFGSCYEGGGAGGGYGAAASDRTGTSCAGTASGGGTNGSTDLSTLFLGGGGGSAGHTNTVADVGGAIGGGIIFISANTITVTGSIKANGQDGIGPSCPSTRGNGGGGAGGSVYISSSNGTLGSSLVTSTGGAASSTNCSGEASGPSGAGAVGRVALKGTFTGTTNPTYATGTTDPLTSGSGAITNAYGIKIGGISGSDNNYGIYLTGPSSGAASYAIYAGGTAKSFFGGDIVTNATTWNFDIGDTGTFHFRDGTNDFLRIVDKGTVPNIVVGNAALGTTATDGFLFIPTSAGAPTGTPTSYTGVSAMEYDTTNNKLCLYNQTGTPAWKCAPSAFTDIAEWMPAAGAEIGDLVEVTDSPNPTDDPTAPFMLGKTTSAYSVKTVGVVSQYAEDANMANGYKKSPDYHAIALIGRVPVKVNIENGPIAAGDPLTSSSTPGVAMKATKNGRVIGLALQAFDPDNGVGTVDANGVGKIIVYINIANSIPVETSAGAPTAPTATTSTSAGSTTINGDLSVLGKTTLGETGITGKLTVGVISIDDISGTINSLTTLKFQTAYGAGVQIDPMGNVSVAGNLNVLGKTTTADIGLPENTGEAVINSGQTSVDVSNANVKSTSTIFLSPDAGGVGAYVDNTQDGKFSIKLPSGASAQVKIKYLIVNQ